MARLTGSNIENYSGGGSGKGSFFTLKNDKDTARVRFLYSSAEDIEGYSVHKVEIDGKTRYVNCLVDDGGSVADCPFCQERIAKAAKLFVPLYNEDLNQIQLWERGPKYYGKVSGLCTRYPNLVSQMFDIERHGKKGDTSTTYDEYPVGQADGTTIEDILEDCGVDELPNPLGTIILDKTADEMEAFIESGEFPDTSSAPIRRRGRGSDDLPTEVDTPSRTDRRRGRGGDRF